MCQKIETDAEAMVLAQSLAVATQKLVRYLGGGDGPMDCAQDMPDGTRVKVSDAQERIIVQVETARPRED